MARRPTPSPADPRRLLARLPVPRPGRLGAPPLRLPPSPPRSPGVLRGLAHRPSGLPRRHAAAASLGRIRRSRADAPRSVPGRAPGPDRLGPVLERVAASRRRDPRTVHRLVGPVPSRGKRADGGGPRLRGRSGPRLPAAGGVPGHRSRCLPRSGDARRTGPHRAASEGRPTRNGRLGRCAPVPDRHAPPVGRRRARPRDLPGILPGGARRPVRSAPARAGAGRDPRLVHPERPTRRSAPSGVGGPESPRGTGVRDPVLLTATRRPAHG